MCGIVGLIQHQSTSFNNQKYIEWCLQTMHHRGPDSNGVWGNEAYHTGFVRLAIRDLSECGNQPMHSQCGRYVLSFNGELYNSDDFKVILEKDGIQFKSTADTEVLLYALIKWSPAELLPKLNGMFAFAFYDKEAKQLTIARDRVGIKPLYIGWSSEGLVYSSQYDHIINHPFCKNNSISPEVLAAYLQLGFIPDKSGIIQNTMFFPHGNYGVIKSGGSIEIKEYYTYPQTTQPSSNGLSLEQVIDKTVSQQLVSDVPLGTFMSGGVDSTLVTSFARPKVSTLKSFTIGLEDKEMDESEAAQAFANIFKTEHTTRFITMKEVLGIMDDNFKAYTEPFADYSSLPTLLLSKITREQVTVALSGDGGDELFWGYNRNQKILKAAQPYRKNLVMRNLQFVKEKLTKSKQRSILWRHLMSADYVNYYYKSVFINGAELWLSKLLNVDAIEPYFLQQVFAEKEDLDDPAAIMNKTRKLETDIHMQRILIKVDRASMYHSLEVRVPLLDNDMLDYSATVDYTSCVVDKQGKYNLKKLLASRTNDSLVFRPKKGFTVPLAQWIRTELYNEVCTTILDMPSHLALYFNQRVLRQMISQHVNHKEDNSWILWAIYSLVKWDSIHRNKYNLNT